jgi:predicted nuclease of predicted toxin-antitoxin system
VRRLLDANLSPRRIGGPQRAGGHDVLALADDAMFEGLDDPLVLELAAEQERVLVTRNSRDFAPLAREWGEGQRAHAGMILIWTLDHSQFSEIVAGVERLLGQWTQEQCSASDCTYTSGQFTTSGRSEATAHGDEVNEAARIEAYAARLTALRLLRTTNHKTDRLSWEPPSATRHLLRPAGSTIARCIAAQFQ